MNSIAPSDTNSERQSSETVAGVKSDSFELPKDNNWKFLDVSLMGFFAADFANLTSA
ncbi:MAG: hypothetical protein HRF49_11645 [bacterium]